MEYVWEIGSAHPGGRADSHQGCTGLWKGGSLETYAYPDGREGSHQGCIWFGRPEPDSRKHGFGLAGSSHLVSKRVLKGRSFETYAYPDGREDSHQGCTWFGRPGTLEGSYIFKVLWKYVSLFVHRPIARFRSCAYRPVACSWLLYTSPSPRDTQKSLMLSSTC